MKQFGLLGALLLSGFIVVSCTSTGDPNNGVDDASYRRSTQKAHDSVAAIVSKLEAGKGHVRTEAWWDAIHDDLAATRDQLGMTLQGSTK